jgi:hypothetical protein
MTDTYGTRLKRIDDAVKLQKPDMVPVILEPGYFPARYAGFTSRDSFYDYEKCAEANEKAVTALQPDAFNCLPFDSGTAMESVAAKTVKWPGYGFSFTQGLQYVEGEYMMADEYDVFLENPSDFIIRTYLPRACGALGALKDFPGMFNLLSIARGRASPVFAEDDFISACRAIYQSSRAAAEWNNAWKKFVGDIENRGFPAITLAGLGQAPFDFFSDHLRGMRGIMLDMHRQPDKLLAAMQTILEVLLRRIEAAAPVSGNKLVFMGPHRGADGFMSLKQFEKFYWPGLKATILALIEKGFTPYVLWEGDYTTRLKYLLELPPGKIICRMDRTDIYKTKEALGGYHCIAGGVTASLLQTGSAQMVKDECRRLIETAGRDGGYIMTHSTPLDEAKVENVMAMIQTTREHGRYHR